MDSFQIRQLIVVRIDADAEEQPSITTVYDLVVPELLTPILFHHSPPRTLIIRNTHLNEVGLVLLIPGRD